MDFYKKTLVLQKVRETPKLKDLTGIVRIESEDCTATLSLSLLNFPFFEKGYSLYLLFADNPLISLDLGKKPSSLIKVFYSLNHFSHFCVGIFKNEGNAEEGDGKAQPTEPFPLLFAKTEEGAGLDTLESLISSELKARRAVNGVEKEYNDEAVATEDYFSIEEEIEKKLDLVSGVIDDRENEASKINPKSQKSSQSGAIGADNPPHEKDCGQGQDYRDGASYYQSAQAELNELFAKFPPDYSLKSVLPDSTFCKIHYSNEKYYIVGIVKEEGEVKYVCYGVPGEYSDTPPEALKDFCSFLPLTLFDLTGKGFWMMFQSALDGKCVKK